MDTTTLCAESNAGRTTEYNRENYTKADIKGSSPYFYPYIYIPTLHEVKSTVKGNGRQLTNKLRKHGKCNQLKFVIREIRKWAQLETSTQSADDDYVSVWASDTLQLDLGIPLDRKPPGCVILQAAVVGRNLPAFILTLYQPDKTSGSQVKEVIEELEEFTTETAQLLMASMIKFSHSYFVLLPCVLSIDEFDHTSLNTKINDQSRLSRRYFRGPAQLDRESFHDLKDAITAVSSASYVPCLLEGDHKQKVWLLLMEDTWRELVSAIIETVTDEGVCDLDYTPQTGFKVKVAILEAAKRLVFTEQVSITTSDPAVESCVKQIIQQIQQDQGVHVNEKITVRLEKPGGSSDGHISVACLGRSATDGAKRPFSQEKMHISPAVLSSELDKTDQPLCFRSSRNETFWLELEDLRQQTHKMLIKLRCFAEQRKVDEAELTSKRRMPEKTLFGKEMPTHIWIVDHRQMQMVL